MLGWWRKSPTIMSTSNNAGAAYPPEELAKLGPGAELDRLVHTVVFKLPLPKGKRKVPPYSLDACHLVPLFGHLCLGCGRSQPGDTFYSEERPYWAGHAGYDAVFVASTLPLALAKAAVHVAQMTEKQPTQAAESVEDAVE